MESTKIFENELIAIGDIIQEDMLTLPTNNKEAKNYPNVLAQVRTKLREGNYVLNSNKSLDDAKIYYESYIKKERVSFGLHDQFDALIHKRKYFFPFLTCFYIVN